MKRFLIPKLATTQKRVWLTFDDGPHPINTNKVLEVLGVHKIPATFFIVGRNAKNHPSFIRKAFEAGHLIGNHSYSHKYMTELTESEIRKEIQDTHKLIKPYLGQDWMFRPPFGDHDETVDKIVSDLGYRTVMWNVDTNDYDAKYQPDGWVRLGIGGIRAQDNSTVLMHDVQKTTADNLDLFIGRINAIGNVIYSGGPPAPLVA